MERSGKKSAWLHTLRVRLMSLPLCHVINLCGRACCATTCVTETWRRPRRQSWSEVVLQEVAWLRVTILLLPVTAAPIFLCRVERASPACALFALHVHAAAAQHVHRTGHQCKHFHQAFWTSKARGCDGVHPIALESTASALLAANFGALSTPIWLVQSSSLDFQPKQVAAAKVSTIAAAAIVFVSSAHGLNAATSARSFRRIAVG